MAVTTQQIAELAGVSRGTVDRALHNRGRVNPEVAARIRKIASDLDYRPNVIGQALVKTRPGGIRLGAIVQSAETPTMQIVISGLRHAAGELKGSGVELIIREISGLDTELVLENIKELKNMGIHGLALSPNTSPELKARIDELSADGIPVIALNSDTPSSKRLCFIGMDNYRAGCTAAGLLKYMFPDGGKVLPLVGHLNNTAHNNRLDGFFDTLKKEGPKDMELLPFQPCFDRDDFAHEITQHTLRSHPDLSCIYVASNGQLGACQAVEEAGFKGRIRIIAFDLNDLNRRLLLKDDLCFVLDQDAFSQGYRPPFLLYDNLVYKKEPPHELMYTDITIRTKFNCDIPDGA